MNTANYKSILLSTAYFPPAGYLAYLLNSENVFIEIHESYPKQTYRNRCTIMTANGLLDLSIAVKKPNGSKTKTGDIIIDKDSKWKLNHWRAIESAYQKAPFYIYYKDLLQPFFTKYEEELLVDWNMKILKEILDEFGIVKNIQYSKEFEIRPEKKLDLRNAITPKKCNKISGNLSFPEYIQVFGHKHEFAKNLSVIDLIFNLGPEMGDYLQSRIIQ